MAKKECSKGHKYDSAIYGDNCPFCPSGDNTYVNNSGETSGTVGNFGTSGTELNSKDRTHIGGTSKPTSATIPMNENIKDNTPRGATVIRPASSNGSGISNGKKLVGLLITYSANPLGECFNIYEGRNYIGRDMTSDICLQSDSQISGRHFSILYRSIDNKFKFKDEQSSNGTFLNEVLEDDGELQSFDIIRVGNIRLIFIAIPQIN